MAGTDWAKLITHVLDALRKAWIVSITGTAATGVLLYAPVGTLPYLLEARASFGSLIVIAFVVSVVLLSVQLLDLVLRQAWTSLTATAAWWRETQILKTLDPTEKMFLLRVLTGESRVHLPVRPGRPCRLEMVGVLRRVDFDFGSTFQTVLPFEVEPWAFERLRKNPALLDGAEAPDGDE